MKKTIVILLITLIASPVLSEGTYDDFEISEKMTSLKAMLDNDQTECTFLATTDPTKLDPLVGTWDFYYTIIDTYHHTYSLTTIYSSGGEYYVRGTDEYGDPILASYYENSGSYSLLDQGIIIDHFYDFNFVNSTRVSGTYVAFDAVTDDIIGTKPFIGNKIGGGPVTTTSIIPTTTSSIATTTSSVQTTTTTIQPVPETFSISGHVTGDIKNNVSIILSGTATETVITDLEGYYEFSDLTSGYYTITPKKEGYTCEPPNYVVQNLASDLYDIDFVSTQIKPAPPCTSESIYGEYSEETELLRYFRDNVLSQTSEGQELIKLYYQWSPVIVKAMEGDEEFKEEIKEMIDGILPLIRGE